MIGDGGPMKISGSKNTPAARRVGRAGEPRASDGAKPISATDHVEILGIPQKELTPKVREALTSLMNEVSALRRDLNEVRVRMAELETLADTDPLLGVLNRRAFVRELNRAMAMAERYDVPSSLVFVDLDALKSINDNHGHAAGDAALAKVSEIIAANIRQTDVFGRLGGDEFGLILTQVDKAGAAAKATSLAALVASQKVSIKEGSLNIKISFGAVEIGKGLSIEDALQSADTAMYEQKRKR